MTLNNNGSLTYVASAVCAMHILLYMTTIGITVGQSAPKAGRPGGFNRWVSGVIPLPRAKLAHLEKQTHKSAPSKEDQAHPNKTSGFPSSSAIVDEGHATCAPLCTERLLGDGYCDVQCATTLCRFDDGDCQERCAPYCSTSWVGDGYCDVECNVESCSFDSGDCSEITSSANGGCATSWINDGHCDPICDRDDHDCDGLPLVSDTGYEVAEAISNVYSVAVGSENRGPFDTVLKTLLPQMEEEYRKDLSQLGINLDVSKVENLTKADHVLITDSLRAANGRVHDKLQSALSHKLSEITFLEKEFSENFEAFLLEESFLADEPGGSFPQLSAFWNPTNDELEDILFDLSSLMGWFDEDQEDIPTRDLFEDEEAPVRVEVYDAPPNLLELYELSDRRSTFGLSVPPWDDLINL